MRSVFWRVLAVFVALPAVTPGQSVAASPAKVLTVCEVLGNLGQYADTVVAVVGRMESSVSITDHYEFLAQGRCEHPVKTWGHVWSNKIQIWSDWEEGMPKPPSDRPVLQHADVAAKLAAVRKTTRLGSHEEPRFEVKGNVLKSSGSVVKVPNEWAAVYGRIVKLPELDKDCGAGGCGGFDVPLVIIVKSYNVHCLKGDGTLLPDPDSGSH